MNDNAAERSLRWPGATIFIGAWLCVALELAGAQSAWNWRNPVPQGNTLNSAAWNGSLLVAVGVGGTILTTSDTTHLSWTPRASGTERNLTSVVWSGTEFVAIAGNEVLKSPDGTTWTVHAPPSPFLANGFTWTGTQFVAVAGNGIFTSPDAVNWTWRNSGLGASYVLRDVAWTGTQLIAAGYLDGSAIAVRSLDGGVTWQGGSNLSSGYSQINRIVWNGSRLVAAAGSQVIVSTTGTSWSTALTKKSLISGLKWTGGRLLAFVGDSIISSPDGLAWTTTYAGEGNSSGIAFESVGTKTVAVGFGGFAMSAAQTAWTRHSQSLTTRSFNHVVSSGSQWVALGDNNTLATSPDGIAWTLRSPGVAATLRALAWTGSLFVAAGDSGRLLTSPDGVAWTARATGTTSPLTFVTSKNGLIVTGPIPAGGGFNAPLTSSDEGVTWTVGTPTEGALNLTKAAWGDTLFVGVSNGGLYTSVTGNLWTKRGTFAPLAVAWGGGKWVAVGASGAIQTSFDGMLWTARNSGLSTTLNSVTWTGSQWVAVGEPVASGGRSALVTSPDGILWTRQTAPSASRLNSIASRAGRLVAVGASGVVLSSEEDMVPPSLTVLEPVGGETWPADSQKTLRWSSANFSGNVQIELSRDSGATWSRIVASAPNVGQYAWTVPDSATTRARVRVSALSGVPSGVSGVFNILAAEARVTVTAPSGGENWTAGSQRMIRWTSAGFTDNVRIEASYNDGATWNLISASTPNGGSFLWTVPELASKACRIRIARALGGTPWDVNDTTFKVLARPPSLTQGFAWTASWTTGALKKVVWTGEKAVITGLAPNGVDGIVLVSTDTGNTWTQSATIPGKTFADVLWTGTQFVAVGGGGLIMTSPDAVTWTQRTSPVTGALTTVLKAGPVLVALGDVVMSSPDGISWTQTASVSPRIQNAVWDDFQLVATNAQGEGRTGIRISPRSGVSFTNISTPSVDLNQVIWTGSLLVAVGSSAGLGGTLGVITSPPGAGTWTRRMTIDLDYPYLETLRALAWSGNQFLTVGSAGRMYASLDGVQWATVASGVTTNLAALTWAENRWIVVGDGGSIYVSRLDSVATPPALLGAGGRSPTFLLAVNNVPRLLLADFDRVERVAIFSLSGRERVSLKVTGTRLDWDGRDRDGRVLERGAYVVRVEGRSGFRTRTVVF